MGLRIGLGFMGLGFRINTQPQAEICNTEPDQHLFNPMIHGFPEPQVLNPRECDCATRKRLGCHVFSVQGLLERPNYSISHSRCSPDQRV